VGDGFSFFPFFYLPATEERRAPQSFSVLSVISGGEILVRKTAPPDLEDRRIADYRKSPLSRLLILND
jgi:hypothetical protein